MAGRLRLVALATTALTLLATSAWAAAFDVRTFRPWANYAIPNGEWRLLDFDGDGRKDIIHIVAGTDYVHTWRSNGNGTFNVGTFRPWAGYAMPNGLWLVADLNGDGREDLVHAVQGRDYVHTWLSRGDGSFTVGSFRPWAGYAIPNGEWRVIDFNGDGRSDLVHIVAGTDYVHTWRSNGNGTFAVGTFRPWAGYAMPNGLWLTGDFDGDGRGDLLHAVANSSYAHNWLSNGNGTFRVGTFSPWPGYAVPNGLWLAGDLSADGRTDILHAVLNRDYVHPWLSTLPRPGEFALEGLEVTQAVQSMAHGVPLVAAKPTVVRAYPTFNGTGTRQVRGTLWVRNTAGAPWQLLSSQNVATVNGAESGNLRIKRENTDRGLNFVVPAGVLGTGTLVAWFQGMTDATTGAAVACSDCSVTNRSIALNDANPLRLRVLGLRYTRGTPAQTFEPRALDFTLIRSWLRRAFPTGDLRMTTATVNATATAPFNCGNANAQLTTIRNADIAAGTDRRTHYYGIVFEDGSANSFFMRGCAAGIPSTPSPGTVASGPTGPGTFGWDNDGSYGDWYTGHELGHTYGRLHIGSGCGESSDDPNYPYASGLISGADGAFVGFDTGDAANGIVMRALPGTVWADVMSYCANQWISDYTYTRIRDRLIAENGLAAGPEPAVAGLPGPGATSALAAAALPGPAPITLGESLPPAGLGHDHGVGVMIAPAMAPQPLIAAAAAAPDALPEPALAAPPEPVLGQPGALAGAAGPPGALEAVEPAAGPLPPDLAAAAPRPAPATGPAELPVVMLERELREGDYLTVVATVNLTAGTAEIVDARRLAAALVPLGDPGGTLELRALDAAGRELGRWNVPFLPNSEREPGEDLMGILDAAVPFVEGIAAIEVIVEGRVADSLAAAVPAPVGAAELRIEEPQGPAALALPAGTVTLDWSAAGVAPEGVSYDVQASTDGGRSWLTVAIGLTEPRTTIDLSGLGADGPVELRIMVKEGFEQRVLDTAEVRLPN